MNTVHSFPPIIGPSAHTLILGSMPGVASLAADEYYAHPRNAFWQIMGELFDAGPHVAYPERTATLSRRGIAVWDVLKLCTRHGSLDSAIDESSIVPNDFAGLLRENPSIERVFFNGAKAESSYARHVAPPERTLAFARLPSTSPAHASMTFADKLAAWSVVAHHG
ncbi:DNA-deoxyinosine glycosylase [Rhodococcoides yunnanense]|uniref:DNA-deoxyinosine glycosylase n=1 Tax=Rhodococcoides yunnanense TaxID=278209 RepID=UPI0009327038|nr:DNA-deoxyinosine glycosylase [Rhodococcus yunnanensis]